MTGQRDLDLVVWGATGFTGRLAAEKLAAKFDDSVQDAERFLDEEEVDSGIIVGRGNEVSFWHLTFQEYLAAETIAWKKPCIHAGCPSRVNTSACSSVRW